MRSNDFDLEGSIIVCAFYFGEAYVLIYQKNSFTSMKGMKKLIFGYRNFFGLGHFLTHDILKIRPKNDKKQKVIRSKNYSFQTYS